MGHLTRKQVGLLAASTLLLLPGTAEAQVDVPPEETSACQDSLQSAKAQLEQEGEVAVKTRTIDMSTGQKPAGYPDNRPIRYFFSLEGQGTEDILHSPQMMQTISTAIIETCDSVSQVTFEMSHTDWQMPFGLLESGKVEQFQCAHDPRAGIPWGYMACL